MGHPRGSSSSSSSSSSLYYSSFFFLLLPPPPPPLAHPPAFDKGRAILTVAALQLTISANSISLEAETSESSESSRSARALADCQLFVIFFFLRFKSLIAIKLND